MLSMPTHEVIVVYKDDKERSIMSVDYSNREEFIDHMKHIRERYAKGQMINTDNAQDWKIVKYCTFDKEQRVIYECSIEEILEEK